ncbi:uncharacterized protein LOC114969882 [Acropora millepora]|uniref:uncharacterized protein LOC114969882 n=1 Tax=Acropora millepora TaxID=45264 RepID=UPI001CF32080|nr:uncharacterized protein LOC114969882 [Acropora millepora]
MTSNSRSTRDRAPKNSIVLSNVLSLIFRPTSTVVKVDSVRDDEHLEDSKPSHQLNGPELFDAFKEANRSTLLTRLTESLEEIRLKGWVFPFTLLIKGPHEDIEVIKEAWRRHFLRSPRHFIIKDIGVVSSVTMEVIQQAPFLPLTKSLLETISALNNSQLTATKQSIAEHLAKTYQYVHVPKLNVIHDCLGILIKEERIHHTDNGYFVTPKEDGGVHESKDEKCEATSNVTAAKSEKAKKNTKRKEAQKEKTKDKDKVTENIGGEKVSKSVEHKVETKEKEEKLQRTEEESNKTPSETASESGTSEGSVKKPKKPRVGMLDRITCFVKGKSFPSSEFEITKQEPTITTPTPPSTPQSILSQVITPQSTSSQVTAPRSISNQVTAPLSIPSQVTAPIAVHDDSANSTIPKTQFRTQRFSSAPVERPHPIDLSNTKNVEGFGKEEIKNRQLNPRQLHRSKSFVTAERRPAPPERVMRSNSFAAPSTKTLAVKGTMTEGATGHLDRRMRIHNGNIVRNSPARHTIHVSRPRSCNVGIVRPLSTNQERPVPRNASVKNNKAGEKGGSLSPPSTRDPQTLRNIPHGNNKTKGRTHFSVVRSRSFTDPRMMKLANRQISHRTAIEGPHFESPLQQLLASKTHGYLSPPNSGARVTIQPKGRHFVPGKRSTAPPKKASPSNLVRKPHPVSPRASAERQAPSISKNGSDCSSPVCYDTSLINTRVENCACGMNTSNSTRPLAPIFLQNNHYKHMSLHSDADSSENIFIEEMTSTDSEMTLAEGVYTKSETGGERNPLGFYKQAANKEGINDSLTFIGII